MTETLIKAAHRAFDGVDGILVINMDSRPERYAHFMSTVGKYLPIEKVERFSAVPGRELKSYGKEPWFTEVTGERSVFWGGTGGCALSHRNAIAYARDKGWKNVLIFEDDVLVEPSEEGFLAVAKALKTLRGAYMFYLGYNRPSPFGYPYRRHGSAEVWKTDGVIAAHAYIVSSELYDDMLADLPKNDDDVWEWLSRYRAIDVYYRDFVAYWLGVNIYVLSPILFAQKDGLSDIGLIAAEGIEVACRQAPRSLTTASGICRLFTYLYRRLKIWLNSLRTRRRALRGGLPGFSNKRHRDDIGEE
ncbi:MAG: glycosyltransferase family 25 protein [Akkermansia sp.]|nr:glycosyltransferase family 25 protein [Akkermansia sp.]